jgi:RimJ/RimL family protein N-acetyltransferase
VQLRPLTRADLDEIEAWPPHTDPLYVDWNRFPWRRLGKDLWHEIEATDPTLVRYAIVDHRNAVIGVIGLVDAGRGRSPSLSIFLGAEYCGRGLGTDALRTLLRHAFEECRYAAVRLQVAATNARARRAYERCGFRLAGTRYRPVEPEESLAFLDDPRYHHLRPCFRQADGRTFALFYDMEIRAEDWQPWDRNLLQDSTR